MKSSSLVANFAPSWREYLELCKPKVVMLLIFTAMVGMCLAVPGMVPLQSLLAGTLGIALAASAAAALNHVIDQRIDAVMQRTANRPLPRGSLSVYQCVVFALLLAVASMLILVTLVNPLTAILTFMSLIGYALVYTAFLKRATPQNIVIGGLAGAMPPVLGWAAVANEVSAEALLLAMIIFVWTPPHFWALALHRQKDYARAQIPVLPVTHGAALTRLHIMFYTVLLIVATLLPFLAGMTGLLYLGAVSLLNLGFAISAYRLWLNRRPRQALRTFLFSIHYLAALFLALLLDHWIWQRIE